MIIHINDKNINVKSVIWDSFKQNGYSYPALHFEFENEITADDIYIWFF